jgi:hypothetical protein
MLRYLSRSPQDSHSDGIAHQNGDTERHPEHLKEAAGAGGLLPVRWGVGLARFYEMGRPFGITFTDQSPELKSLKKRLPL